MHTVVTSFAPDDWERYAKRFLDTYAEHWPSMDEVQLVVVHEYGAHKNVPLDLKRRVMRDGPGDNPNPHLVSHTGIPGLCEYIDAVSYFPVFRGEINGRYSINYDARMARKTFIEEWACKTYGGKVFWVDADVITHAKVTTEWLDELLPDDMLCCFLGREKMHTESGFIGYNADHELCAKFMEQYKTLFTSGTFVTLPAWHDCVAFDVARQAFDQYLPGQFNNLGQGVDPGPGLHVFINSVLGSRMDHLKGNRKKLPRSPKSELTVERTEPHWK